ncbi:MAG TPA: carbohydrate-binding domain-containing protein [Clostridia bacterium]|nr:carbohydrate-binding domain-containing protein [Clostridia bacterium]
MKKRSMNMKTKSILITILVLLVSVSLIGCSVVENSTVNAAVSSTATPNALPGETSSDDSDAVGTTVALSSVEGSLLDISELFTERDIEQTADLTDAIYIELSDDKTFTIDSEGVYVLKGDARNASVIVDIDEESKVQLVLDGVTVINESSPVIYIKSGDKVFITTTDSLNSMEVTGNFEADGDTNLDAVIFSKSDLTLNGQGTLEIVSAKANGITSKDDLKITGGTYVIDSYADAIEANDSIRIYDGNITIETNKDGLHAENEEDTSLGYIYIHNGTLNITAADDAIRATSLLQIDGGTISIPRCSEGIEGTYIQINGGDIDIYATDDGINATAKSSYDVVIEVNGGNINVSMGSGDTDAFDSNGIIYVNGGTINIDAQSAFDADYLAQLNAGTVYVNGQQITQITVSMPGRAPGKR